MAIRDLLARFERKASIIGLGADELPDRALEKGFNDAELLSTYGDDAWPYIVGNKVGEQASQAPLQIGRIVVSGGKEEFEPVGPNHPVQNLFDAPSDMMDGGEFIHLLVLYMGFTGHAPIEFVKPKNGAPIIGAPGRRGSQRRAGFELHVHNPHRWRIVANSDGTIRGYLWLGTSTEDIKWLPDQMTYLRWPNPSNRWYGQGHIQAIRQQVMAEEYAAIRDKKFEQRLGVPPGILSSELPLGEPQAIELQKRWEQAVGGYRNAGKIAVLGSKTTYQGVAMTARDAEWLKQRHDRVEIICGAWGVPLPLVKMQDAKFANAQEARAEFWEGTLQPRLNRIGRMITQRVLPLVTTEPLVARFDYTKIEALGENDLEAAQTAGAWSTTGVVTVDEVRLRLGLDPHKDKAFGQKVIVPSSLSIKDPAAIEEEAALGLEGAQAAIEAQRNPPPEEERRPPPRRSETKADKQDIREGVLAPIRTAYEADLAAYFRAQRGALNEVFKALPSDEAERILERAIAIITAKRWRDRLRRFSEGPIASSLTLGATEAAQLLGVAVSFSIPASEAALARLTGHLETLGVGIQNTTVNDVRRVLEETLRAGASNAETRKALDELFGGYEDWRLDRISRTETTAAYNLGAIGQYRDAGVTRVLVTDGDGDANCAPWNGRETTLDEAEGSPLGHPNCTRAWIPLIDRSTLAAPAPEATKQDDDVRVEIDMKPVADVLGVLAQRIEELPGRMPQPAAPVDLAPMTAAMTTLGKGIDDMKREVRKPRKRTLITDATGKPTGSIDVIADTE